MSENDDIAILTVWFFLTKFTYHIKHKRFLRKNTFACIVSAMHHATFNWNPPPFSSSSLPLKMEL
jgi:hypothetical protein